MNIRLLLSLSAVVLAGCSAYGGKDSFECPNKEVGATCLSARDVYAATHVADRITPNYMDGKRVKSDAESVQQSGSASGTTGVTNGLQAYRPPIPEVDTPLPIRTPAKVMRIRVFPWEDSARDLNTGGYVYTEIEGRIWTIGEEQVSRVQTNVVNPLTPPNRGLNNGSQSPGPLQVTPNKASSSNVKPSATGSGQLPPIGSGNDARTTSQPRY